MKLILENKNKSLIKSFSQIYIKDFEELKSEFKKFGNNSQATIFADNTHLKCNELKRIKNILEEVNIKLNLVYSCCRETILSAKSIKIEAIFDSFKYDAYHANCNFKQNLFDHTFKGTVRSGNEISSNGNLIIIGDVNPGAKISAKKNIYVWGKLCGIAYAGSDGDQQSTISSLYLKPLQLRINNTLAIVPQEKPKTIHPEIALLKEGQIVIKPLLIS